MPSIYLHKRKRSGKTDKCFSAQIRFGRKYQFLRSTGEASERKARERAKEIVREIERDVLPYIGMVQMNIDTMFGRWWIEHGRHLKTANDAQLIIDKILTILDKKMLIRDVDDAVVNKFVQARLGDGVANATINRHLDKLRSALRRARKKWKQPVQEIDWSEHRLPEPKERFIIVEPDELKQILQHLPIHIGLAVAWSVYTGSRLDETRSLIWANVYRARKLVASPTKGGGMRLIPLGAKAEKILNRVPIHPGIPEVFDLTNRRKFWEAARKAVGRTDIRWHDLRHITGTWLDHYTNISLTGIQHTLGHSDIKTTRKYVHPHSKRAIEALNKLPDITSGLKL